MCPLMLEGNSVLMSSEKKTSLRTCSWKVMLKFTGRWDDCVVPSELEMMQQGRWDQWELNSGLVMRNSYRQLEGDGRKNAQLMRRVAWINLTLDQYIGAELVWISTPDKFYIAPKCVNTPSYLRESVYLFSMFLETFVTNYCLS